jgi:hypothetical protein
VTGFEPATFCTPCRRASQVTLHPDAWLDVLAGSPVHALATHLQYGSVGPAWQRGVSGELEQWLAENGASALRSGTKISALGTGEGLRSIGGAGREV